MSATKTIPRVSIILPTYNRAEYILETIDSVRNQTYLNWELLVVDDGSTDNTIELVTRIKDERVQLHKTESRLGIAGTRNKGLEIAEGDLIAFIDSDDLWVTTKLEKQVVALLQYPEAGFSLTGGYNFRKRNEPIEFFYKQDQGIKYGDVFIAFFKSEVAATIPTLILRKECLQMAGTFTEAGPTGFFLSLANHFKAAILYEPLFYRRLHTANFSNLNWEKRHYDGLKMIRSYKSSLPAKVFRDSLFRSQINFGEQCLLHREIGKAIHQFFKAWKNKPFNIVPLKKIAKAVLYRFKK